MNLFRLLKCIHRHTIDEHPNCFASGAVNPVQAARLEELTNKFWYNVAGYKIGYLDIESDGLKVDFATMLSYAIKERDGETITGVISKDDLFSGRGDKDLVDQCITQMRKFKIICTYNGTNFDISFLRAKALHYGLSFPGLMVEERTRGSETTYKLVPEIHHYDLYFTVKNKLMALSRKSLESACDYLGISGKTPIEREIWRKAKYGDADALREVLIHNVQDVKILEELHKKLEPFVCMTRRGL